MMPSALFIGLLVSLTFGAPLAWAQSEDLRASIEALQSEAAEEGLVRVLVRLRVDFEPEAMLPSDAASRRSAKASRRRSRTCWRRSRSPRSPSPNPCRVRSSFSS